MKNFHLSIVYNALRGYIPYSWRSQGTRRVRNTSFGAPVIRSFFLVTALWGEQTQTAFTQLSYSCRDHLYVNDPTLDHTHKFTINEATEAIIGEIDVPNWLPYNTIQNRHSVMQLAEQ